MMQQQRPKLNLPPEVAGKRKYPFQYTKEITVSANSEGSIEFQVPGNYDYLITSLKYRSKVNSANVIPYFDILIEKDNEPLASDFQANENFNGMMIETSTAPDTRYQTGDGTWYYFPIPQMVNRKSTIRVRLRDRSGQSNTIQIALDGIRVFG